MTVPFFPFELDDLIIDWDSYGLVTRYTEGECYDLATVLFGAYGWPVYILSDCGRRTYMNINDNRNMSCHAVAQAAPDVFIDVAGAWRAADLRESWEDSNNLDHMFRLPHRSIVGLERHFRRLWSVRPEWSDAILTWTLVGKLEPQIQQALKQGRKA